VVAATAFNLAPIVPLPQIPEAAERTETGLVGPGVFVLVRRVDEVESVAPIAKPDT
jgi:hypothetical protein